MKETFILGAPMAEDNIIAVSFHKKRPTIINTVSSSNIATTPVSYEEAIHATGFGKYNILFLFVTIPSAIATICATTSISYMLSDAQCDLDLSLNDKGMLNAITYIGMIFSAFLWGIIGDIYGRRTVLLYSYGLDGIIGLIGTLSTEKWMLMLAKFCSGFVMSGPVSVSMCYLCEFHSYYFRPKLITILGVSYGIARTMLPLLAWWIMPLKLNIVIIQDVIEYKSWQIYLLISCIPSLLAALTHYFLPETPKFLMSKGRYEEAMEIFKKIYVRNTGNPVWMMPFSELTDEIYQEKPHEENNDEKKSTLHSLLGILKTMKPLFLPPYLAKTFLMCGIFFGGLLGGNTLRLWLPQIFTTMNEYQQSHNNTGDATLCEMLDYSPKTDIQDNYNTSSAICTVPEVTDELYINNTIVPLCSIVGYFVIAAIISTVGKKTLLVLQYALAGFLAIANYWSKNSLTTVILSSLYLTFFSICATTATGTAVELFPTNMRTLATSLFLFCGRCGSILGNTTFPLLLTAGCLPPFLFIGGFMFLCAIFSMMLPGTENKALK